MLSITLSLLLFIIILLFVSLLLIPKLVENIKMLINSIPRLIDKIRLFVVDLLDKYPAIQSQIEKLFSGQGNVTDIVSNFLNYFVNGAVGFVSSLVTGFVTIFTATMFSIYMLSQKEYLIRGSKKVIYAITNKKKADRVIEIGNMANNTFSKFLSVQCLEAVVFRVFNVCGI